MFTYLGVEMFPEKNCDRCTWDTLVQPGKVCNVMLNRVQKHQRCLDCDTIAVFSKISITRPSSFSELYDKARDGRIHQIALFKLYKKAYSILLSGAVSQISNT